MYVQHLELNQFRNYPSLSLDLSPGDNIFVGQNAQGKTNILEAVYLMSCARSHRTGRDQELVRRGESSFSIQLEYSSDAGVRHQLRYSYEEEANAGGKDGVSENALSHPKHIRRLEADGIALERVAELFGLFQAVIFAPEDLSLIKDGPVYRRRFLDILLSQVHPSYFRDLQLYQRILLQRNTILKQFRERGKNGGRQDAFQKASDQAQLAVWSEQLCQCAGRIMAHRMKQVRNLEVYAREAMEILSADAEGLELRYQASLSLPGLQTPEEISKRLLVRLEKNLSEDILRGYTAIGPHRDDLEILLNELPARTFASQGQQRSLVLALKMAELRLKEAICEERPVLLLDDVMSELDGSRRSALFDLIRHHQVFLTCTDLSQVEHVQRSETHVQWKEADKKNEKADMLTTASSTGHGEDVLKEGYGATEGLAFPAKGDALAQNGVAVSAEEETFAEFDKSDFAKESAQAKDSAEVPAEESARTKDSTEVHAKEGARTKDSTEVHAKEGARTKDSAEVPAEEGARTKDSTGVPAEESARTKDGDVANAEKNLLAKSSKSISPLESALESGSTMFSSQEGCLAASSAVFSSKPGAISDFSTEIRQEAYFSVVAAEVERFQP